MPNKLTVQRRGSSPPESQANSRASVEGGTARDAERTRGEILDAATEEFADKGLSGARIDAIAHRTSTSKRMIYYYFGSKQALYRAVLEREYRRIRDAEAAIGLERMAPDEALEELVRQSFDWHVERPTFVRLVMNENIHRAEHLKHVAGLKRLNQAMIESLAHTIGRGVEAGRFRRGIDAVDLHTNITALCFYTVSNRYTFRQGFSRDMWDPSEVRRRREQVVEVILRWCAAD
jgi:AcrR family transcriptional regulator